MTIDKHFHRTDIYEIVYRDINVTIRNLDCTQQGLPRMVSFSDNISVILFK